MPTPGFTAEYGLYRSSRIYQGGGIDGGDHLYEVAVPAMGLNSGVGSVLDHDAFVLNDGVLALSCAAKCVLICSDMDNPENNALCYESCYNAYCAPAGGTAETPCNAAQLKACQNQYPPAPPGWCYFHFGPCGAAGTTCCGRGADRSCVDLQTHVLNCGSCGQSCPGGSSCCGGSCCSSANCCEDSCCDPTDQCCPGGTCCAQTELCCGANCCSQGQQCCNNACTFLPDDPLNCGSCGNVCQTNQTCIGGNCQCNAVPTPDGCCPPPYYGCPLGGNVNYFLVNGSGGSDPFGCQDILGLTVTLTATQDIVSDNGFTMQLNAGYGPAGGTNVTSQQYAILVKGNSIQGLIENWSGEETLIVCGGVNIGSTPIPNGIPQGYVLRITLQYQGNSVSGAFFEVSPGTAGSQLSVSQAGCNCDFDTCTGYASSADLSPITNFQVNIVGFGDEESTNFTPTSAGSITYTVSSDTLAAVAILPLCAGDDTNGPVCTEETSNASYGPRNACPSPTLSQSFGV